MNLLINATHAMPDGGVIDVSARRVTLDAKACKEGNLDLEPGDYVEIMVADSGCGISEEHLGRIYDPFFTTKEPGRGTGLGLSTVFSTAKQHRGAVTVQSEVGKGTTFCMFLPVLETADAETVQVETEDFKGSGKILLIDDEPSIRAVTGKILTGLGCDVALAENGRKGLDAFIEEDGSFDLVILDMVMPEMNGADCFRELKKVRDDIPVVFFSGFTNNEDLAEILKDENVWFLQKPFQRADLEKVIRQAMKFAATS